MEHLELPELNELNIRDNQKAIELNRDLIKILIFFVIGLSITIWILVYRQHNIETCQAKLYTHLTGQKAPSIKHDLFEKDCSHD